jgi:chemotaxis protein MotB
MPGRSAGCHQIFTARASCNAFLNFNWPAWATRQSSVDRRALPADRREGRSGVAKEVLMTRALAFGTSLFLIAAVAGCASSSKLKKTEADLAQVQGQKSALEGEKAALQKQTEQLTQQNTNLTSEIAKLSSESQALSAQRDSLQQAHAASVSQYDAVVSQLSQEVDKGNLQIRQYKNMLTVDVAEKIFFASGSSTLKASGKEVLQKVGAAIAGYPDKIIRVVGHTDNVPLRGSMTNWELSVMRATNVVRFLQDKCKIDPQRLVAAGRSEYQPVAANDTPEGRQKNRRIEITLMDKSYIETMRGEPAAEAAH